MAALMLYLLTYAIQLGIHDLEIKIWFSKVGYIGIVIFPLAWFAFTQNYIRSNKRRELSQRKWFALALVPAITLILVWTNEWHHAVWYGEALREINGLLVLTWKHGIWFWVHITYSYVLIFIGAVALVNRLLEDRTVFRLQIIMILIGLGVPLFFNGLYLLGYSMGPVLDPTMLGITVSGIAFTISIRFCGLFRIIPIAKSMIINRLDEGIFVLDQDDNIVYINRAARKMIGFETKDIVGHAAAHFNTSFQDISSVLSKPEGEMQIERNQEAGTQYFRVSTKELRNDRDYKIGRLLIMQDITPQRLYEEELLEAQRKELLMQELNHRTKNNLIMVSSLVRLKNSASEEPVDLSDLEHQINAIRLVHEKLCYTESTSHIDIGEYLHDLLATIFTISNSEVTVVNWVEETILETRRALPIGLIVNEIATNAIKYGFQQNYEKVFSISMKKDEEKNTFTLTISHTGIPFPEEIDLERPKTLGLKLISILVKEIDGVCELTRSPSPAFEIRFPIKGARVASKTTG